MNIDPAYERWQRKYPKRPGLRKCLELIHAPHVRGAWREFACMALQEHAREAPDEVIAAFRAEPWDVSLLGAIVEARLPQAVPLFVECLQSDSEDVRRWAIMGLEGLDTKEARRALWDAGVR